MSETPTAPDPPVPTDRTAELERDLAEANLTIRIHQSLRNKAVADQDLVEAMLRQRLAEAEDPAAVDLGAAVDALLAEKPLLQAAPKRAPLPAPSVSPRPSSSQQAHAALGRAAAKALQTGQRADLLEYLRKRREIHPV